MRLYNTMTRQIETLAPSDGQVFRMYCCGPTVYGPAHIGNFRTFILQDILRRTLEAGGLTVRHVRNITDVDDKTIRQSLAEGASLADFTERWSKRFEEDAAELNLLPPHVEPRATAHLPQQTALIETLLHNGHAYAAPDGSVYFKIESFPRYGCLSGLDKADLRTQAVNSAGQTNAADEYEREQAGDFALWKARKESDGPNFWDGPRLPNGHAVPGRPGWHIECSAMSMQYLGESFDLHGGGVDLCFPHHENEIAQSEAATGRPFCKHWFHGAHLQVEGRKMSKSLGNLYTLADLRQRGATAMEVRYALLSGHYRQPLNFTFNGLEAARGALGKLEKAALSLLQTAGWERPWLADSPPPQPIDNRLEYLGAAWEALNEDLNTPSALGKLFEALGRLPANLPAPAAQTVLTELRRLLFALGLKLPPASSTEKPTPPAEVIRLAEARWEAKRSRQFAEADRLRGEIARLGWKVVDRRDGFDLEPA